MVNDLDDLTMVRDCLHRLAPPGVRCGGRLIREVDVARLFPEELDLVPSAVAGRRNEFATGRVLLRELLQRDVPILMNSNRSPATPGDVRVSLSHDAVL